MLDANTATEGYAWLEQMAENLERIELDRPSRYTQPK